MLYFPTFQLTWHSDADDRARESGGSCDCSSVENSVVVREPVKSDMRRLVPFTKNAKSSDTSRKSRKTTSTKEVTTWCIPGVREKLRNKEVPEQAINITMSSWRRSTQIQYRCYIKKWVQFCGERKISAFERNVNLVLEFFTLLYNCGSGYSCLDTTRSALSTILSIDGYCNIGEHPLISRFMKGVFTLRPALPNYKLTWDVNIVSAHLR